MLRHVSFRNKYNNEIKKIYEVLQNIYLQALLRKNVPPLWIFKETHIY